LRGINIATLYTSYTEVTESGFNSISVGLTERSYGYPVVITAKNGIWLKISEGEWEAIEGCGVDVSVGVDNTMFVAGTDGNAYIYNW